MGYEYTASDHIDKPLQYHYTAYQGTAFMQEWCNERKKAMMQIGEADPELQFPDAGVSSLMDWEEKQERTRVINTNEVFSILLYELRNGKNISGSLKRQFDGFVKTFEVRKRLYPQYSLRFKPMDETAYWNVALYADFAYICATALTGVPIKLFANIAGTKRSKETELCVEKRSGLCHRSLSKKGH